LNDEAAKKSDSLLDFWMPHRTSAAKGNRFVSPIVTPNSSLVIQSEADRSLRERSTQSKDPLPLNSHRRP
jgi:hypothetical protein